jgi:hypothetical protein
LFELYAYDFSIFIFNDSSPLAVQIIANSLGVKKQSEMLRMRINYLIMNLESPFCVLIEGFVAISLV